jgi:hypothetical protein
MFAIKQLLRGFASPAERARMAAEDLGLAVDRPCPHRSAEAAYLSAALEECASDVTRMLHRWHAQIRGVGAECRSSCRSGRHD